MTLGCGARYAGRSMTSSRKPDVLLVLTTCGSAAQAEGLAEQLVGRGLAACVNVLGGVHSTYRWQGKLERSSETLLLIKTTTARYAQVETAIRAESGYELPEVVAVPVTQGLGSYLDWVRAMTDGGDRDVRED